MNMQHHVREMIEILDAPESDDDERAMALHTLHEILFSEQRDGSVTLEHVEECAVAHQPDGAAEKAELDDEERRFSERLQAAMDRKGMNQSQLADALGLHQSAISMMLSRKCRPQQRTVRRLSEALGVSPTELWPG